MRLVVQQRNLLLTNYHSRSQRMRLLQMIPEVDIQQSFFMIEENDRAGRHDFMNPSFGITSPPNSSSLVLCWSTELSTSTYAPPQFGALAFALARL